MYYILGMTAFFPEVDAANIVLQFVTCHLILFIVFFYFQVDKFLTLQLVPLKILSIHELEHVLKVDMTGFGDELHVGRQKKRVRHDFKILT